LVAVDAPDPEPDVFPPVSIPKDGLDLPPPAAGRGRVLSDEEYKARVHIVAAYRAAGYTYKKISKLTGLSGDQIRYASVRARQIGIATAEIQHRLDHVALPLAVEGLIGVLEDPTHDRFYDAIRDTLYGRGEFRNHSHSVSDNRNVNLTMVVEYEMPDGQKPPDVVQVTEQTGLMVGKPRDDPAEPDARPADRD
jgi:hypothetical protein